MNNERSIGLDYGRVRVGVACESEDGQFAFPYAVFANDAQLVARIVELVHVRHITTIVMGDSRDFSGEENAIMSRARALGDMLKEKTGCRLVYEDETLTSAQARRAFEPAEKTRAPDSHAPVDAAAAALILQTYLDKRAVGQ